MGTGAVGLGELGGRAMRVMGGVRRVGVEADVSRGHRGAKRG